MKVMIATPVYGDLVSTGYHRSILGTIDFFAREFPHIEFVHQIRSTSFFPHLRSVMASNVLDDPSFTHLLMIDPDMEFGPALVAKMLAVGKPVVGAVYPEKQRDFDAFRRVVEAGGTPIQAQMASVPYVPGVEGVVTTTDRDGRRTLEVVDGFVRARRAGVGFLLVAREALETLRAKLPELWIAEPADWLKEFGLTGGYLQCFAVEAADDGLEVASDVTFSRRWVEGCGGEIWSCVDEPISRLGMESHVGQFLARLACGTGDERLHIVETGAGETGGEN